MEDGCKRGKSPVHGSCWTVQLPLPNGEVVTCYLEDAGMEIPSYKPLRDRYGRLLGGCAVQEEPRRFTLVECI